MHVSHSLTGRGTEQYSPAAASDTPVYDAVVADLGTPATDFVVPGAPELFWEEHLGYLPA